MQTPVAIKSRSVLGASEITLLAPLKSGLIPALDTRSYVTRATAVLNTLQALGVSRREIDPTPAIVDVADSIRSIRSFRMAIVGPAAQQEVLLSVSFDGGWEPYMRRIWRPLGPLLDLIFCNCEGYLLARTHSFADYAAWVRRSQVATGFYYEDSPLTVWDRRELMRKRAADARPAAAMPPSLHEQGRAALVAFYRLADLFPPVPFDDGGVDSDDSETLRQAARLLLRSLYETPVAAPPGLLRTPTERAAWNWFRTLGVQPPARKAAPTAAPDLSNVQGGILKQHEGVTHGCLVLVGLDDAAAAHAFIQYLQDVLGIAAAAPPHRAAGPLYTNVAFTPAGLEVAGLDAGSLAQLPQEFREGMPARASVLGDWLHNHPDEWTLPERHDRSAGPPRVALSTVQALLVLSYAGEPSLTWQGEQSHATKPLLRAVAELDKALQQAHGRVLSVQPMQRFASNTGDLSRGHFGFVDGISQPTLDATAPPSKDTVAPGDLLLGYRNQHGDPGLQGRLWTDSTFVVVRKLQQNVQAFEAIGADDCTRLMGRDHNGVSPAQGADGNGFDYSGDAAGAVCAHFSHVRRANPRATRDDLPQLPRIVRRGMSYGPRYADDPATRDRGLVFMAFNASIAEQFEVIQGWLAGGNSSGQGSYSGLRDPLLGVAMPGDPGRYDFADGSSVCVPAEPLVTLQWGLYAFVPSLRALAEIRAAAADRMLEDGIADVDKPKDGEDALARQRKLDRRTRTEAQQVGLGSALIARLQHSEQALGMDAAVAEWKIALEDAGARAAGYSRAIWAAIRKVHGGVLRTPYGVLVGSEVLVNEVFANTECRYTVSGYNTRLKRSFGDIHLGRDEADERSTKVNAAVMAVSQQQAYGAAYLHTQRIVGRFLLHSDDIAVEVRDLVDSVLAGLCADWFGIPDGQDVFDGGWHWNDSPEPRCPAHFHAPSRYTFQPQPGAATRHSGEQHGKRLKEGVENHVRRARQMPPRPTLIGTPLFAAMATTSDAELAATLIGVMMGFLPTVDGNLRGVLADWTSDRSLWDHQAALRRLAALPTIEQAFEVLGEPLAGTMQSRPVPELVWRTALVPHTLGSGPQRASVRTGDTVVVSIVSATQQALLEDRTERHLVFGGDRKPPAPALPHPAHACPGYDMAIGTMLGFLAALMCSASLRPTATPASLRLSP